MVDFFLNANGDIDFIESNKKTDALHFNFLTAKSNVLNFNFYSENYDSSFSYLPNLQPGLILNMYIDNIDYDKEISLTESNEELLYQKLKIRLSSIKNTISNNENIGSTLDNYKHIILNSEKENDFTDIKNCVAEAIKDILPNAIIDVKKIDTIYSDYSNSLIITIKSNDFNYYYYL